MICPFAVWKPVPSHSGTVAAHYGLVVHVEVGTGSCYPEFDNTANQASSTWWIGVDGTLEQYVDTDLIAWTEMAGNPYYSSVETEGTPDVAWTVRQAATLARLIAWGHDQFGWPLQLVDHGQAGVTTHAHYPSGVPDPAWGGHPCPGPVRAGQLPAVLAAAKALIDTPAPPAATGKGDDDMALTNDGHAQYIITVDSTGKLRKNPLPPGVNVEAIAAGGTPNWGTQAVLLGGVPLAG